MNELQLFENPEFGQIRAIEKDGEPWFVLKDVCEVFGETNYRRVSSRLDDDEKGVSQISTPGGPQNMTVVNEYGLYSSLFAMQPEKARGVSDEYIETRTMQLKSFKRWITHDVLPSIRKTGSYSMMPKDFASALRAYADEVEKRERLEAEKKMLLPKAEYFDEIVFRETNLNFRNSAKELNVKPKDFIHFLLSNGFLYRDSSQKLLPYETAVEKGLFVLKECYSTSGKWSGCQTLVTPEGRATFRILMKSIRRR